MTTHVAYIGLGSNLQDPYRQLHDALVALDDLPGTRVAARSSFYRSAPLGCPGEPDLQEQPDYLNAVARIVTVLTPQDLMKSMLSIELQHGRERTYRNAPRTLDLDVLLYDELSLHEHGLTIPHPQMHKRAFVLKPLLEIAPDIHIPGIGGAELALAGCLDQDLERIVDAV